MGTGSKFSMSNTQKATMQSRFRIFVCGVLSAMCVSILRNPVAYELHRGDGKWDIRRRSEEEVGSEMQRLPRPSQLAIGVILWMKGELYVVGHGWLHTCATYVQLEF